MPYYLYHKKTDAVNISYVYTGRQISIAGCNNGVIASELQKLLTQNHVPPIGWTLPLAQTYNARNLALIVDLNPKGAESSMAEIDTVFGFSYQDWSPIMLRLKLVTYWADKSKIDEDNLCLSTAEHLDTVYTMLYLRGSFDKGQLKGHMEFTWSSYR